MASVSPGSIAPPRTPKGGAHVTAAGAARLTPAPLPPEQTTGGLGACLAGGPPTPREPSHQNQRPRRPRPPACGWCVRGGASASRLPHRAHGPAGAVSAPPPPTRCRVSQQAPVQRRRRPGLPGPAKDAGPHGTGPGPTPHSSPGAACPRVRRRLPSRQGQAGQAAAGGACRIGRGWGGHSRSALPAWRRGLRRQVNLVGLRGARRQAVNIRRSPLAPVRRLPWPARLGLVAARRPSPPHFPRVCQSPAPQRQGGTGPHDKPKTKAGAKTAPAFRPSGGALGGSVVSKAEPGPCPEVLGSNIALRCKCRPSPWCRPWNRRRGPKSGR